jgi:hypothetical protein
MVERHDSPDRVRRGERAVEPAELTLAEPVRVEEEQVDLSDAATVVPSGHPEQAVLVAPASNADVVVAERARDEAAVLGRPAERGAPVAPERRGALRVVVVAEGDERLGRVRGGELLGGGARPQLPFPADAEVADRKDARVRGRRNGRREGERGQQRCGQRNRE